MFVLSLRLMMDEDAIDFDVDSLEILLKIFLTLVKKVYIISDIISSNMNYEIVWLFSFSRIFSFVPPEKFTVFTLWLTLRPFSEAVLRPFSF